MQNYADYFRTCQHVLHRGIRRGQACGQGCTFDVYGNRADFCSTHYVAYLRNPNASKGPLPRKGAATAAPPHPTYETMIVRAVVAANKGPSGVSRIAVSNYITTTWGIPVTTHKTPLRLALRRGVENGTFVKVRASYRLTAGAKARVLKVV